MKENLSREEFVAKYKPLNSYTCFICGESHKVINFNFHLENAHNLTLTEYINRFWPNERTTCVICEKPLEVISITKKFAFTCGRGSCWRIIQSRNTTRQHITSRETQVGLPRSSYEFEFEDYLIRNNIKYEIQFLIPGLRGAYDFYLPDFNLLIEIDGVYWHCIGPEFDSDPRAELCRKWDRIKSLQATEAGYTLFRITDVDMDKLGDCASVFKLALFSVGLSSELLDNEKAIDLLAELELKRLEALFNPVSFELRDKLDLITNVSTRVDIYPSILITGYVPAHENLIDIHRGNGFSYEEHPLRRHDLSKEKFFSVISRRKLLREIFDELECSPNALKALVKNYLQIDWKLFTSYYTDYDPTEPCAFTIDRAKVCDNYQIYDKFQKNEVLFHLLSYLETLPNPPSSYEVRKFLFKYLNRSDNFIKNYIGTYFGLTIAELTDEIKENKIDKKNIIRFPNTSL